MTKFSFENFIMKCCGLREWNLRKFLRKTLSAQGFRIIEDDYRSQRVNYNEKYNSVHNMLAIRGDNPKVCLVAHTDVCRDHGRGEAPDVRPIIKTMAVEGNEKQVIQDKDCKVQVGGDDRLGVAINTWIALNTGYDMGLLFCTDEEIGVVSSEYCQMKELLNFELLAQVDRGNHHDQLVTHIGGTSLCDEETAQKLIKISADIGLERYCVHGLLTDVLALRMNGLAKNAVNMTCGYMNSYGSSSIEYIDIQKAKDTLKYVSNIINSYELGEEVLKA